MNNLDKRILVQVAHKEAVDFQVAQENYDPAVVEETAQVFYEQLVALIEKYGASEADTKEAAAGGTSRSADEEAPETEIAGVTYKDFRGIKKLGGVDPNFPDFKLGTKGFWLQKKDGSPTKFAIDNNLTVSA